MGSQTGRHNFCDQRGFTLVELLVVIAIIGILVSLLLPAVQAARAAAQSVACKNNMRNIALGILNYESVHRRLPPGFIGQDRRDEAWGWPTFILPFLEEQALYDRLGVERRRLADLFIAAGGDLTTQEISLVQTPLPIFRCGADESPPLLPCCGSGDRHFRGNHTPGQFEPSVSNYMGVKGFFDRRCDFPSGDGCDNNGTFYGNSDVTLQRIEDGTSKTFLIGERDMRCKAGTWIGARNPPGAGMFGSHMLIGRISVRLNFPLTGAHNTCTEGFSSNHVGGAHFNMVDGSVRFINEGIDFNNAGVGAVTPPRFPPPNLGVYQRLGVRDDGLAIGEY